MQLADKVSDLCRNSGTSMNALEKELGFGKGTIYRWNDKIPSVDKVRIVADYFGVSVDYLLGRSETEDDDIMEVRERLRRQPGMRLLFDAADGATAEQLEAVAEMIKAWKES